MSTLCLNIMSILKRLLSFSLKQHCIWNVVSPELALLIWWIDRRHRHSWDGCTHQELLTVFNGKLRFQAQGALHSRTSIYMIKDLPVKEMLKCYLSWPWANFLTTLFFWQIPTNFTWIKGSRVWNLSYSCGKISDLTDPWENGGNASPVFF